MTIPYFGNKKVLDWEEDRALQHKWLMESDIRVPAEYAIKDAIFPVIVKSYDAAGGAGYFFAANRKDFDKKIKTMQKVRHVIQLWK